MSVNITRNEPTAPVVRIYATSMVMNLTSLEVEVEVGLGSWGFGRTVRSPPNPLTSFTSQ